MSRNLMRLEEIAEHTGVSINTLRYWRARGQGEGPRLFRLGRRVVAYEDDVERWISEQAARDGAA
jgi:predicted DNA-binding transcriptional regulator AlpA